MQRLQHVYGDATRNLEWENCEEEAKKKQQQHVTRVTFLVG